MSLREFLRDTHRILDSARIPHALIGGFAMAALGVPRATNDVDYLVHGDFRQATKATFRQEGFSVFHSSAETLQLTGQHPLDILFANRPLSRAMLSRAERGPRFLGIPHLDAADIVGLKIQAYKNDPRRELPELADILKLAESVRFLDRDRVLSYADLFEEKQRIEALLRTASPHDS